MGAPALSACGGLAGDAVPSAGGCQLSSTTPVGEVNGGCIVNYLLVTTGCAGDGGPLPLSVCGSLCAQQSSLEAMSCQVEPGYPDGTELACQYGPCGTGRRPPGWRRTRRDVRREELGYLQEAAQLEAASVTAFRVLARELRWHRAPKSLRERARRAAREEATHTHVMNALAAATPWPLLGRRPTRARVPASCPARAPRELAKIARDNAVEGCVRETFGAAIALLQAMQATDPAVRAAMVHIARDEMSHADFSWDLDAWIGGRLESSAQRRTLEARREAVGALEAAIESMPRDPTRRELGLPTRGQARSIFETLRRSMWTAA